MAITDIELSDITDRDELHYLQSLEQFRFISDDVLFKLARRVTIFRIPSRWTAIRLIVANGIPIPVVTGTGRTAADCCDSRRAQFNSASMTGRLPMRATSMGVAYPTRADSASHFRKASSAESASTTVEQ